VFDGVQDTFWLGTVLHHRTLRSRRFNSSAVFTAVGCSWTHSVCPAHSSGTRQARVRRRSPS